MNKRVIAAGSIITSLVLLSAVSSPFSVIASASSTASTTAKHLRQRGIGAFGLNALATKLGLTSTDVSQIKQEIQSGKKASEVLKQHNIDISKLETTWSNTTKQQRAALVKDPVVLQAEAIALGISVDELKQELSNGQKIGDLIKVKGLTMEQFIENSANAVQTMINNGTITTDKVAQYTKLIKKFQTQVTR